VTSSEPDPLKPLSEDALRDLNSAELKRLYEQTDQASRSTLNSTEDRMRASRALSLMQMELKRRNISPPNYKR
jgi:hypothetical protein